MKSFQFADFEGDLVAHELRKSGRKVKLQDQPFRLLALLVERSGEAVSRDEIREALWPADTFVEFEQSLNTAVRKLRQALDDDASEPRYIETVPRCGYRFIGILQQPPAAEEVEATPAPLPVARSGFPRTLWLGLSLGALGLLALLATLYHAPERVQHLRVSRLTADAGLTYQPALSADGKLIAYASDRAGTGDLDVWVKHWAGGEPVRLTRNEADDSEPAFSRDGGRVAFRSERNGGGIYVTPSLGGTEMLVARGGRSPKFSPDGRSIAYWTGAEQSYFPGEVYVVPSVGGTPRRVGAGLAAARFPVWSPDGSRILVLGHRQANTPWHGGDWWLIDVVNDSLTALAVKGSIPSGVLEEGIPEPVQWLGGRETILFPSVISQTTVLTSNANVWRIPITTMPRVRLGQPEPVTSGAGVQLYPSEADNGRLVFADVGANPDIWSVRLDPVKGKTFGEPVRVMVDKSWESQPMVSHDGSVMAFRSDRGGTGFDFWMKNIHDGTEKALTAGGGHKSRAALSTDGGSLGYYFSDAIHIVQTADGARRSLPLPGEFIVTDWTAGQKGLILTERNAGVILFDVTRGEHSVILAARSSRIENARLSRDNRWILFTEADSLWVAPFRGAQPVQRDEWRATAGDAGLPRWSDDGNMVYFTSGRDGWNCLWAVRLNAQTKEADGMVFPVHHFHRRRYAFRGSFDIAGERLLLGLHETTGNLWRVEE